MNEQNKNKRDKRGLKFFFFPKPQGLKHKHGKNKYYVSHNKEWSSSDGSIMSGDSPLHHNRTAEIFDISSSTTPPSERPLKLMDNNTNNSSIMMPTTSKDAAVQIGEAEVEESILVKPAAEDEKDALETPNLNNENDDDGKKTHHDENSDNRRDNLKKNNDDDDEFRKNGNFDKLDGVWVPNNNKEQKSSKESEDDDNDNCIVKCLYVTMTCCECSIM